MAEKNPEKKKKQSRRWLADAALQNPVLVQATGLTAIIVAATTLQGALLVSVITGLHLIICELLASAMKRVPSWLRAAVYFAVGLAIACPAAYLTDGLLDYLTSAGAQTNLSAALSSLRIFLPLMAVNALTALRCERYAILHTARDSLHDALANALGFAGAALLVGAVREVLGYGSLWGVQLSQTLRLRAAWMPFGGFLILGAMAAVLKTVLRALSARGIYRGAEKALELAPENRLERLEKTRRLLISDVREALENEQKKEQPNAEIEDNEEPEEPEIEFAAEPADEEARPRIPVEDILQEYGLEGGASAQPAPPPLSEEDKQRLMQELEELFDDLKDPEEKQS